MRKRHGDPEQTDAEFGQAMRERNYVPETTRKVAITFGEPDPGETQEQFEERMLEEHVRGDHPMPDYCYPAPEEE